MLNFSYTISPFLKKELETLALIRDNTELVMLSPLQEIQFSWDALVDRLYFVDQLTDIKTSKKYIVSLLTQPNKTKLPLEQQNILGYKSVLQEISFEWVNVPNKNISIHSLVQLYRYYSSHLNIEKKDIENVLTFLQVNPEPPIIQAATGFIMMYHALGKNTDALLLSILFSYILLSKGGYSFRNFLVLEEHFATHKNALDGALMAAVKAHNLSPFLDFFIFAVEDQAKKVLMKIREGTVTNIIPDSFFDLTERHKQILFLFEKPSTRVSNKDVQKQFKISQITASRDLSRLANLGLIHASGRGRSVYYTKA